MATRDMKVIARVRKALQELGLRTIDGNNPHATFFIVDARLSSRAIPVILHQRLNKTGRYCVAQHEVEHYRQWSQEHKAIVLYADSMLAFSIRRVLELGKAHHGATDRDSDFYELRAKDGFAIEKLAQRIRTATAKLCKTCERTVFSDPNGIWRHEGNGRSFCTVTVPVEPR